MTWKASVALTIAMLVAGVLLPASPVSAEEPAKEAAKEAAPAAPAVATLGKPAPSFTLTDQAGKKHSLADYAGKIVVLEWMNPDCPVSRRHYTTPTMKDLATKYGPKGVVWLAVNSTNYYTDEKNAAWIKQYKLPYAILNDQPGDVGHLYDAKTTPDMRIIDAKGVLVYAGAIDDNSSGKKPEPTNYVAQALDELQAGKKVSRAKTQPYGCSVKYAAPVPKAPAFTLTDQAGKKHSLADYAGKVVVLEWMNPDCPISRRHYTTPTMKNLATKYAPKGVVWLAINSTNYYTPEQNKAWAEKYALPYPILDDRPGTVGHLYGAKTTPDMRIIDARGVVVYAGAIDDNSTGRKPEPTNYVAQALDELLAGKKVSRAKTQPYGCSVKYAKKPK
jgi:peroxiredoxin